MQFDILVINAFVFMCKDLFRNGTSRKYLTFEQSRWVKRDLGGL